MKQSELPDRTRRTVLKAVAGALGVAGAGAGLAGGHPESSGPDTNQGHDHSDPTLHDSTGAKTVGYHSLGGVGSTSVSGRPETPHYGGLTELRVNGDRGLAIFAIFSSRSPTEDRGMAVVDVSDYTRARTRDELEQANPVVLSFLRNDNPAAAVMDAKFSDDGRYAFLAKEPFSLVFDDPGIRANTDNHSHDPSAASIEAVDVSDPGNPEVVGSYDAWAIGPHNCYYHQINGREYVFAVSVEPGANGLVVLEFDRRSGQLRPVNARRYADAHDFTAVDDPRTGRPVGYFAGWDVGLRVLDLTDPTDLNEIGHIVVPEDDPRTHYVQGAPTLIHGKRLAMVGQETPSQENGPSGYLVLVDCDGLDFDAPPGESPELAELDRWTWAENVTFNNYYLGPHNGDVTKEGWIHLGHYHGGTRYFEITNEDGDVGLDPHGVHKPSRDVPEASRMQNLTEALPFVWCAVENNGLTFAGDINSGLYVAAHQEIDVGTDVPVDLDAARRDAASVFTAGQTIRMNVDIEASVPAGTDADVLVRDRIPAAWDVFGGAGDVERTHTVGPRRIVEFTAAVGAGEDDSVTVSRDTETRSGTRTYLGRAPDETGSYLFGPVEYSVDGGETWTKRNGAVETNVVVGVSTAL